MPNGCHNCKRPRSAATCAKCRVVDFDDIQIASTPHVREEMLAAHQPSAPSRGVTALPPDAEDALRRALAAVVALDPVSVLLLHHVANGGSLAAFSRRLAAVADAIRRFGSGMSRQTAHAKWSAICAAFKPFSALAAWRGGEKNKSKERKAR